MKQEKEIFIEKMRQLAHKAAAIYCTRIEEFPCDDSFQHNNVFFAGVLFDVAFHQEPLRDDYLAFEGEELDYQVALGIYKNWQELPLEQAIEGYCQVISMLLDQRSAEKVRKSYYVTPNYLAKKGEVKAALEEASMPQQAHGYFDRFAARRNL